MIIVRRNNVMRILNLCRLLPPETRIDYDLLVSGSFTLPPEINLKISRFVIY